MTKNSNLIFERLHTANIRCKMTPPEPSPPPKKYMSATKLTELNSHLFNDWTESAKGMGHKAYVAVDIISPRKAVSKKELDTLVEHFYTSQTECTAPNMDTRRYVIKDEISKAPVDISELITINDRLFSTHTEASNPAPRKERVVCENLIGKPIETEEEIMENYNRLTKTSTKASSGSKECKPIQHCKIPGIGSKIFPVIEGLEHRFLGLDNSKKDETTDRLVKTQTTASQARLDNIKVLLYPEITLLMNEPERIKNYQETGSVVKQAMLQRREKWFN